MLICYQTNKDTLSLCLCCANYHELVKFLALFCMLQAEGLRIRMLGNILSVGNCQGSLWRMTGGVFVRVSKGWFIDWHLWLLWGYKISFSPVMSNYAFLLVFGLVATSSTACDKVYDILDYGAEGDGITDNSYSLSEAWKEACYAKVDRATVIVPRGKTFLVKPIEFSGPCRAKTIRFQISGQLIAPSSPEAWKGLDASRWISFSNVRGLHVNGHGTVDGQGTLWWNQSCKWQPKLVNCTRLAPTAMKFLSCEDSSLSDLHFINSPQAHISILSSNNVRVSNMIIEAPGDSPNTDGIHIHRSRQVTVDKAWIGSGDDCVSIQDYTSKITIMNVYCGPGHGISIGSLGKSGNYVKVENILVKNVEFKGTTNGARIKTWQVGRGYVRNVIFQNLSFSQVKNPIIIDQNYCDVRGNCSELKTGVHISNVVYNSISGTSSSKIAINLNCSRFVACTKIYMKSIHLVSAIRGKSVYSSCTNAHGRASQVVPASCLIK
uniref:endo-polygalacturonase n=1 Tax=Kalanchoe fedtschenkoi TaxID=63787 RepID=A0A7N0TDY5_KALFE